MSSSSAAIATKMLKHGKSITGHRLLPPVYVAPIDQTACAAVSESTPSPFDLKDAKPEQSVPVNYYPSFRFDLVALKSRCTISYGYRNHLTRQMPLIGDKHRVHARGRFGITSKDDDEVDDDEDFEVTDDDESDDSDLDFSDFDGSEDDGDTDDDDNVK